MYLWIWLWAPRLYFPWSGSVAQRIEPDTNWLFASIEPGAGNGAIEKKTFQEVASYGKQLGLITEVLLGLADKGALAPQQYEESLMRLKEIRLEIERVKNRVEAEEAALSADTLAVQLERLRAQRPVEYRQLLARMDR